MIHHDWINDNLYGVYILIPKEDVEDFSHYTTIEEALKQAKEKSWLLNKPICVMMNCGVIQEA